LAAAVAVAGALSFWGCKDGNLFGSFRNEGSGDTSTVLADASAALSRREFNNAKAFYESIVAKEPQNSEALYGAAVATMGTAGLDLGTLLSNVITAKNASSGAATTLQEALQLSAIGVRAISQEDIDNNSILKGLDLNNLDRDIDQIVCFLLKIRSGNADGKISPKDISVLMSVGITCIIRGILRPLEENVIDLRQTSGGQDYEVKIINGAKLKDLCDSGVLQNSASDIAGSVQAIQTAVAELKPSSGSTIASLKPDLENALKSFQQKINAEAAAQGLTSQIQSCLDFINGFDVNNLTPPTKNPGDCLNKSNKPLH
jgi:hypothetical protein